MKDVGLTSQSDPFLVVNIRSPGGKWIEQGRTEIISNSLNPGWVKRMIVYFKFEEIQEIQFDVYSMSDSYKTNSADNTDLSRQKHIGTVKSVLGTVVKSSGAWVGTLAVGGYQRGKILVKSEEVANSNTLCKIKLRCSNLKGGGFGWSVSPFLKISKLREDGQITACFKSEVKANNNNPVFAEIKGSAVQLANGDMFRPMKVRQSTIINKQAKQIRMNKMFIIF